MFLLNSLRIYIQKTGCIDNEYLNNKYDGSFCQKITSKFKWNKKYSRIVNSITHINYNTWG